MISQSIIMGTIQLTKIPTSSTGKSGPPQKVDQFFLKLFRLDQTDPSSFGPNFWTFWLNGTRPICSKHFQHNDTLHRFSHRTKRDRVGVIR